MDKVDRKRIVRWAGILKSGDMPFLVRAMDFCGFEADSSKDILISVIQDAYDGSRTERIFDVIKKLSSREIVWLSENYETICAD